jgi:hypothetical protein
LDGRRLGAHERAPGKWLSALARTTTGTPFRRNVWCVKKCEARRERLEHDPEKSIPVFGKIMLQQ